MCVCVCVCVRERESVCVCIQSCQISMDGMSKSKENFLVCVQDEKKVEHTSTISYSIKIAIKLFAKKCDVVSQKRKVDREKFSNLRTVKSENKLKLFLIAIF